MRQQIRRAHLVHELGVDRPPSGVFERFGFDQHFDRLAHDRAASDGEQHGKKAEEHSQEAEGTGGSGHAILTAVCLEFWIPGSGHVAARRGTARQA